jgi:hypothetical protein
MNTEDISNNVTTLRIENAQSALNYAEHSTSVKTAHKVGVFTAQGCKNIIIIPTDNNKKEIKTKKDKKDRIVTRDKKWTICDTDYNSELQLNIMKEADTSNNVYNLICCEIMRKISGYKSQDQKKNKYSENDFIDIDFIKAILIEKELKCYYCCQCVHVLYKQVREPKQWSVERMDNKYGHNKNNITIACLECNLKRKTIYHERFRFTKQLKITKTD